MIEPSPHLQRIHRVVERGLGRSGEVPLDRNERIGAFSDADLKDMLSVLTPEDLSRYPDTKRLYQRLSATLAVDEEQIYLTPGSDGALRMLFHTYVRPGDRVLVTSPTYAMYSIYTEIFQGQTVTVEYNRDRTLDLAQIEAALDEGPRIFALANPNQPTGTALSKAEVRRLLERSHPDTTLVIVDEAYFPFHPDTVLPDVHEFENLVVTRTFSKIWGLAGLRVGYLVGNPEIVCHVSKVRGAHEVNAVAISMAAYVLDHPQILVRAAEQVAGGRAVLRGVANDLGLSFPECVTNFQLVGLPAGQDSLRVVDALRAKGYLVKGGFSAPSVEAYIRVTLAAADIMEGFAEALREVLGG